jgi:hypothetical protein
MRKAQAQGADSTHAAGPLVERTEDATRNEEPKAPPVEDRESALEELNYEPVPPRRSVSVQVICHLEGRGQPLPLPDLDA